MSAQIRGLSAPSAGKFRFPHIQKKHIPAFSQRRRLNHQLARFRNRHEVPHNVFVCERYRAARLNLLLKPRYHGTGTP